MRGESSTDLHGVVSRAELLAAGVGDRAIEHRLATGRLFQRYRGVYAVGRRDLSPLGERRAIVLACGEEAILSRRSAAAALGLRPSGGGRWEVTIPPEARRAPRAPVTILRHRLSEVEVATLDGIPTTTVARTLLDLAAVVPPHHLRPAVERADQLELFDLRDVERVLRSHPRHQGRRPLIALLGDARDHGLPMTRSDPEAALLQLCLDHGLPRPHVNRYAEGREVDFRWPEHRLIVEIDGWWFHRSRRAFANDRARDRRALREGHRVARFPADEVLDHPAAVATELAALLRARA
jgi:very-short-patch-repair endonuclease